MFSKKWTLEYQLRYVSGAWCPWSADPFQRKFWTRWGAEAQGRDDTIPDKIRWRAVRSDND